MLFVGSFRHEPNVRALQWFVDDVLPKVGADARLIVAGADMPANLGGRGNVEVLGYVEDIRERAGAVCGFVCPILSGSGIRVKLLEAFAAGIPVVSTRIGAEGLAERDGEYCRLADLSEDFARAVTEVLGDPRGSAEMAGRARRFVEQEKDMKVLAGRLVESWARVVEEKRRLWAGDERA